ncbi:MAG: response regulator [Sphaerochaetaceae bacterium]|nr:response regulator [Sphaerochaetaceae bacterium]
MQKVLIVDDEFLVRMGLKSTIDWEVNGFHLVGEAKNAKEAVELFRQYSPQIVLTDISMPGLNGIELIRELKGLNPHLQSIILTHLEDFTYAKEAVGLGVVDYILKSNLNPERLLEVLKKATKRVGTGSDSSQEHPEPAGAVSSGLSLEELFLSFDLSDEQRTARLASYSSFFSDQSFQVYTFRINTNMSDQLFLDDTKRQALKNIISQSMFAIPYTVHYHIIGDTIQFLVNFSEDAGEKELNKKIVQHFQTLAGTIKKYLNFYILVGASDIGETLDGIGRLMYESDRSVDAAFFAEHHFVQFQKEMEAPRRELKLNAKAVLHLMQSREHTQVVEYIDSILETAKRSLDYAGLYGVFTQSLDIVKDYNEWSLKELQENTLSVSLLEYQNFYSLYDYEAVRTYLVNVFLQAMHIQPDDPEEDSSGKYSYIIQRAINYIKKNYYENISLLNVANHVEVSRSYLSFLFKHELGVNFSSFLTETRINQAKVLLSKSNMKIYEVAEDVGFDSPYYFSKVFKEVSGLTCKEYRNENFKEP